MCLSVHIKDGKLTISKQGELGGGQTFYHNQGKLVVVCPLLYFSFLVTQLIKSRSKEQKLGVLFEGHNRKDYVFNSMQVRSLIYITGLINWLYKLVVGERTFLSTNSNDSQQTTYS